jgi:hypothetical protein
MQLLNHAEDREERHGRAGAYGEKATPPLARRRLPQAERRASFNPIVRLAGSTGPSVMTLILFSKKATPFGFLPTAKSVGPPLKRADVATLLKQTVADRGSLDFCAERGPPGGRALKPCPHLARARTVRRVGRADAAGIEAADEPRTPIAFFRNVSPPNARDFAPCRTSGLGSMSSRYLWPRFSRVDHAPRYAGCHRQIAQAHRCWANSEIWSLDLRGPEPRRTGARSGGNL